ncbi:MAG: 16S rRNA (cytosine(1402)-N(4))-methyltransferase RsmH [Actinomycetota bacterium]|nr:MAG: 16S rRNA (cytosine(1402)-N(4))-methyltransferase RsmH [Actinomycetota bacterium]
MTSAEFLHRPVMFEEVMAVFAPLEAGTFVDGTLGGGGHSQGLLERGAQRRVLGLDRDPSAIEAASRRLSGYTARFMALHKEFDELDEALAQACQSNTQFCGAPTGLLLDLGVSSPQLERGERGFSYRLEGPLDMRMDPTKGQSLAEFLDQVGLEELASLLRSNGEPRFAYRIAKAIMAGRPYASTTELAEVVKLAIPAAARRTGGHPATRVFQALRIRVNNELERLEMALVKAFKLLRPGGRIAVLSYHSGEDSIVKSLFREQVTGGCTCPSRYGCVCGAVPKASYVVRSKAPSVGEIEENPRSRSARLRAIEILEVDEPVERFGNG